MMVLKRYIKQFYCRFGTNDSHHFCLIVVSVGGFKSYTYRYKARTIPLNDFDIKKALISRFKIAFGIKNMLKRHKKRDNAVLSRNSLNGCGGWI